jgi:site-specific DNA-methyltransferase (adenine-specific)
MINKSLFSSNSDEWYTPMDFFTKCSDEVWGFDLDPCSDWKNAKTDKFYTKEDDGLSKKWIWKVFCNPPYSDIAKWAEKCHTEIIGGADIIYFLIPARTDTRYFHDFLYKKEWVELRFIKWRLKFGWSKNSAPFPSLLAIFTKWSH